MVIAILVILGLVLGSFINAFAWRHYQREVVDAEVAELRAKGKASKTKLEALQKQKNDFSIVHGRSKCTHCGHTLVARDLIPVVSYLWLRGKCRYCGKPIEDNPLAELLTPLLFVISYIFWPFAFQDFGLVSFILWLVFIMGFVALILYDLRWFLLPHNIVLPLIGLAVLQALVGLTFFDTGVPVFLGALYGAIIIGGLFYALYKISKEQWIGGGDITLGFLLGLLAGGPAKAFLVIFLASLLGTFLAIPLLITKKATRSTHLPFGPFLIIAGVVVVLFGSQIINWYTGLFTL